MGLQPRISVLATLLLLAISLSISSASEVSLRQTDCNASNCTACLAAGVQCAWCNVGANGQHCYNSVTDTCPGLTLRFSCIQEDACYQQTNCADCTAAPGCGWCDTACVLGGSTGPDAANIKCTEWIPAGTTCNTTCSDYGSTCAECESQPLCNWCLDDGTCQDADNHGACLDWAASCPDICSTYTDCLSCANNVACTWCNNAESPSSCVPSSTNPGLNCDSIFTKFCDDTCVSITSCGDCTANPACGWCDTQCVQGNDAGPFYGVKCNNWLRNTCSVPFTCQSTLSCDACNADQRCCFDLNSDSCVFKSTSNGNCQDGCPSKNKISGIMIFFLVLLSIVSAVAIVAGAIMWYKFYWQRRHYFERLA